MSFFRSEAAIVNHAYTAVIVAELANSGQRTEASYKLAMSRCADFLRQTKDMDLPEEHNEKVIQVKQILSMLACQLAQQIVQEPLAPPPLVRQVNKA